MDEIAQLTIQDSDGFWLRDANTNNGEVYIRDSYRQEHDFGKGNNIELLIFVRGEQPDAGYELVYQGYRKVYSDQPRFGIPTAVLDEYNAEDMELYIIPHPGDQ